MTRPVVQVHTIAQWFNVSPDVRAILLQNLKLKDRLWKYLVAKRGKKANPLSAPTWVKCHDCETKGWVLREPRYPGIHPSQIGSPCLLKIYNEMMGKEGKETFEARQLVTFDIGSAVHRMFQSYGSNGAWGSYYKPEITISEEFQELAKKYMIEGHADADNIIVIDDIPNSPIYEVGVVHEYKTMKSEIFEKLTRPKPEHKEQAGIYQVALDRPIVGYLYVNKNDSNMADFPVPFDPDLWARTEGKISLIKQHYDQQAPPAGEAGYHCNQCAYSYDCTYYIEYARSKGRR